MGSMRFLLCVTQATKTSIPSRPSSRHRRRNSVGASIYVFKLNIAVPRVFRIQACQKYGCLQESIANSSTGPSVAEPSRRLTKGNNARWTADGMSDLGSVEIARQSQSTWCVNWWRSSNLQNSSERVHHCRESHSLVRPSSSRISFYRQHEDDAQVVRPNQRSSLTRAQKVCAPTKMHKVIVPLPVAVTDRHVHAHDAATAPESP